MLCVHARLHVHVCVHPGMCAFARVSVYQHIHACAPWCMHLHACVLNMCAHVCVVCTYKFPLHHARSLMCARLDRPVFLCVCVHAEACICACMCVCVACPLCVPPHCPHTLCPHHPSYCPSGVREPRSPAVPQMLQPNASCEQEPEVGLAGAPSQGHRRAQLGAWPIARSGVRVTLRPLSLPAVWCPHPEELRIKASG